MILWVIGAGGLFGSAICRVARSRGDTLLTSRGIPWKDERATEAHLRRDTRRLTEIISESDQPWGIAWSAGAVTTATTSEECATELTAFRRWIAAISESLPNNQRGAFFLTSSAGGVYAGSRGAPFDARTPAAPIGDYGQLNVAKEVQVDEALGGTMAAVLGRVANLYGPGQNTGKLQGLISRLCLASITREPLSMFVSLDTLRDFLYVDDAAFLALHWIDEAHAGTNVRVIASGFPSSLGHVIGVTRDVVQRPIPIVHGFHPSARAQSHDMRLKPDVDAVTEAHTPTSLPVGIRATYLDLLVRRWQRSD